MAASWAKLQLIRSHLSKRRLPISIGEKDFCTWLIFVVLDTKFDVSTIFGNTNKFIEFVILVSIDVKDVGFIAIGWWTVKVRQSYEKVKMIMV